MKNAEIQPNHAQKQTALIVIDLQKWFLEKGSEEKLRAVPKLIQNTNDLIRFFAKKKLPVFIIQTVHKADKSTWNQWALENNVGRLIEGTEEAEYSPEVIRTPDETVITKTRLSAFLRTDLERRLRSLQCNQVVICGYSTDNCVGQTAIDAYEYDFKVILAGDAILGTTREQGDLMLRSLEKRFGMIPADNQEIKSLINTSPD
jgi:nicotinamidase-related amidase